MITLINPNIVMQMDDFFGTGIPYMPVELAYAAAVLRKHKVPFKLIDSFGLRPTQIVKQGNQFIQGLTTEEIISRIPYDTSSVVVYCGLVVTFNRIVDIIGAVKKQFPAVPVVCIENTQQVTAFSMLQVAGKLFEAGADILVVGDPELRLVDIVSGVPLASIKGIIYRNAKGAGTDEAVIHTERAPFIDAVDELPYPAWDLFPLKNYWKLGYSHAPLTSGRYLPLLTSRGCPFGCRFCVIPATNLRRWKPRSARNVVDEIDYWVRTLGVREFHVEDLNPTIRKERMVELSKEIVARRLKISFKFGAGTKIETLDEETIDWLAKAGLAYLSCSPESGSPAVLKNMDKPFNHERALELIRRLSARRVTTQACFVLGFLGETEEDLQKTKQYAKRLVQAGIDEMAFFIMTPIPGTFTFDKVPADYTSYSQLTFSPRWRKDYKKLAAFRIRMYVLFMFWKLRYHPFKLFAQPLHFLTRRFSTKMEMTAFRWFKLNLLALFARRTAPAPALDAGRSAGGGLASGPLVRGHTKRSDEGENRTADTGAEGGVAGQ